MNPSDPHPSGSSTNLRRGLIAATLVLVAGAAVGASVTERIERRVASTTSIAAGDPIIIDAGRAVDVIVADVSQVQIRIDGTWSGPDAPNAPRMPGGVIVLPGCNAPWWKDIATYDACDITYHVSVPSQRDVRVQVDCSDVRLSGTFRSVTATTGCGDITARDLTATSAEFITGSGGIDLNLTTPPRRLLAHTNSGDVSVVAPVGQFAVDATSGSGDLRIEPAIVNGQSPDRIALRTDSGDIDLRRAP